MKISRRSLLGGAAAACLPLPFFHPRKSTDDVLIIGAGAAGMAAGLVLQSQEVPFRILEARNRVGGRVLGSTGLSGTVDLGAAWMRGATGNPITELANLKGVHMDPFDDSKTQLYQGGAPLGQDQVTDFESAYGEFTAYLQRLEDETTKPANLEDAYRAFQKEAGTSGTARAARDWYVAADLELGQGAALSELSAAGWNQDETFPGIDALPSTPFASLFQAFMQGMAIQLGEIVSSIVAGNEHVTVTTNRGTYVAREVICTLPLGVLQSGSVTIRPTLDDDRLAALKRLRMGSFNKIALEFGEEFWPQDSRRMGLLPPGDQRQIFEVWNMSGQTGRPILVLQYGGPFAKRMEALDDASTIARAMATLRGMFGSAVTTPVASAITRWSGDPFSRGCFTHLPPGATLDDVQQIGQQQGRIHFAGEHTSTYLGALHGAILSGRRAAKEALR